MNIPFNRPFIAGKELFYIAHTVMSGKIAGDGKYGRMCEAALEARLGHDSHVLLTTSCTHALEMAALLLDIHDGDEVIMPSYTFVSTANAFCLRGGIPVFADVDDKCFNIDLNHVERLITRKTKAIVAVHYGGVSCDMDRLMAIAARHNLKVIEDAAQALNSDYKGRPLGTFGCMATISFHETKNLICGEGGALLINDPIYRERAEIIREKGTNRSQYFRSEIDKYSWVDIGSSYILSDILAAFLYAQIEHIDENQSCRSHVYFRYQEALEDLCRDHGIAIPYIPDYNKSNHHIFYLVMRSLEDRQAFLKYMKDHTIDAVFHYVPLHHGVYGREHSHFDESELRNTVKASECLLRLPLFPTMTEKEQEYTISVVKKYFGGKELR